MFKNILVPLDGSSLAKGALPYAEAIARRTGATLTLVRTAHISLPLGDVAIDQQRAMMQAEDYLASLADEMRARGFSVETAVPFGGSAAAWIIAEIEMRDIDLIVMATHGRIGPDRWLHGSVAEAVVNRSSVPVMLIRVPDQGAFPLFFDTETPVLLVPLDGSELAEAALPTARNLAQSIGARIVLVGVVPKPGQLVAGEGTVVTYVGAEHARLEADASAYLEASIGRVGAAGVSVETSVQYGDPAAEIAAAAQEHGAAAVVMATHGRTGLLRSVLGSVAGGVVHRGTSPVVLIRSARERAAEQRAPSQAASVSG